jgi:hypothetical protein
MLGLEIDLGPYIVPVSISLCFNLFIGGIYNRLLE